MRRLLALSTGILSLLACHYLFASELPQEPAGDRAPSTRDQARDDAVDLNQAPVEELLKVPGIGPVAAVRILHLRAQLGSFDRPEQLMLVVGMSEKRFRKIRPFVTVSLSTNLDFMAGSDSR